MGIPQQPVPRMGDRQNDCQACGPSGGGMNQVTAPPGGHTPVQRFVGRVSRTIGTLRGGARPGLRVLLYHSVSTDVSNDSYGMSVTPAAFADQMRWLREESGYGIVSLDAGAAALARGTLA